MESKARQVQGRNWSPGGLARFAGFSLVSVIGHLPHSKHKNLSFNLVRDFEAILLLATSTHVLVVRVTLPAKSIKELIALAQARRSSPASPAEIADRP